MNMADTATIPTGTDAPAIEAGKGSGAAPEGGITPSAAPTPKPGERLYTVKINGKEEQWPESKVLERAQKAEGAEKAMERANEMERAFTRFVQQAQDPKELLKLLDSPGIKYDEEKQEALMTAMLNSKNPRILTAVKRWIYENEIEPSTLDPKDRKIRELEAFKKQQEADELGRTNEQKEKARQAAIEKSWNHYRTEIGKELTAVGLPLKEATVARTARYALLQKRAGVAVDLKDCAARVKADMIAEFIETQKDVSDDNILDIVGEDMAKRINSAFLKRIKKTQGDETAPNVVGQRRANKPKERTKEEIRQWRKNLDRGIID
jgi:hypothetical protein